MAARGFVRARADGHRSRTRSEARRPPPSVFVRCGAKEAKAVHRLVEAPEQARISEPRMRLVDEGRGRRKGCRGGDAGRGGAARAPQRARVREVRGMTGTPRSRPPARGAGDGGRGAPTHPRAMFARPGQREGERRSEGSVEGRGGRTWRRRRVPARPSRLPPASGSWLTGPATT